MRFVLVAFFVSFNCIPSAWGGFSIVHHFDNAVQNPKATGIYEGQVYGITDYFFTTVDSSHIFSFGLDGANFRSRNTLAELSGFGPRELASGPLGFHNGSIYGLDDLGRPYTASTFDLMPTKLAVGNIGNSWVNPIILGDNLVFGASMGSQYGTVSISLTDATSRFSLFAGSPTSALATDGSTLFAAAHATSEFGVQGELVSISESGTINPLRTLNEATHSLAHYENRIYGFGNEGLYSINPDGTGLTSLKSDITGIRIVVSDGKIYGVAAPDFVSGNADQPELLFQINTDGTGYRVLHEFGDGENNGFTVNSDLTVIGSMLYGSTEDGGDHDQGTYYAFDLVSETSVVPEPSSLATWLLLLCCGIATARATSAKNRQ